MGILKSEIFDRKTGAHLRTEYKPTDMEPSSEALYRHKFNQAIKTLREAGLIDEKMVFYPHDGQNRPT